MIRNRHAAGPTPPRAVKAVCCWWFMAQSWISGEGWNRRWRLILHTRVTKQVYNGWWLLLWGWSLISWGFFWVCSTGEGSRIFHTTCWSDLSSAQAEAGRKWSGKRKQRNSTDVRGVTSWSQCLSKQTEILISAHPWTVELIDNYISSAFICFCCSTSLLKALLSEMSTTPVCRFLRLQLHY